MRCHSVMAVASAGNNLTRSRSPSDRYIIPRLSLQNNHDVELSPRAPLSPRGNPPAAPYMSTTPRSASADNLHKPLERISPRFGPRDENHPEKPPSQNGRLVSIKGSSGLGSQPSLTARSSSASKIRTALRERSASSVRSSRERRPNPLLGNSPPARTAPTSSPSKVNQSRISCGSASSSASSEHSGPSLGSKTVVLRSGLVTPSTSTTSLIVPYAGHRPVPAGVATASANALTAGEEPRRTSCDGSARSHAEGHPRSSVPMSTTSEDFQGLSQGGPLPPVEAEDLDVSQPWGSEQVEFLCQKAQSLVRQMGAHALSFEAGACSRPPSARSSPCIKVSPPLASPCTPCSRGDRLQNVKFSPGGARAVLPDITNLQREDLTDLKNRLSQVEQVLKLGPPASSEVLKLRGRMQTVESELVDVRAELKEVRMAVSRFATEPGEGAKPGPIRACHGVASPAMPSPKQAVRSDVRRPSDGTPGQAVAAPPPFDQAVPSPRKFRAPITVSTFSPFQQTRAAGGLASPSSSFMQRMTMHFPSQVVNAPQTVRVHPSLRPPSGLVMPQPMPLHLGQWHMTPA
mgnify:FL=1